jgi:hypothetical protein
MDYTALHTEISTDPTALGYAAMLATGSDAGLAAAMNAIGTARISRNVVTKEIFFVDFGPQMLGIFSNTDLSTAFEPLLKMLYQVGTVDYSNAIVQGGLANMAAVASLNLTSAQVQTITTRPCSRAETLFGGGVVVTNTDIAQAMKV